MEVSRGPSVSILAVFDLPGLEVPTQNLQTTVSGEGTLMSNCKDWERKHLSSRKGDQSRWKAGVTGEVPYVSLLGPQQ
jgi:hypothetical protein